MVALTGVAVAAVATGGVAAIAGMNVGLGAGLAGAAGGTTATVAGTSAAATAGGAIVGTASTAATGATVGSVVSGAVAGGSTAAGIGCTGLGTASIVAGTGGWGLLVVGVSKYQNHMTYDCWKPVIHDKSQIPSNGMLLKDLINHPNVANVIITGGSLTEPPSVTLENIWSERFEIEYLTFIETGKIACHAKLIS